MDDARVSQSSKYRRESRVYPFGPIVGVVALCIVSIFSMRLTLPRPIQGLRGLGFHDITLDEGQFQKKEVLDVIGPMVAVATTNISVVSTLGGAQDEEERAVMSKKRKLDEKTVQQWLNAKDPDTGQKILRVLSLLHHDGFVLDENTDLTNSVLAYVRAHLIGAESIRGQALFFPSLVDQGEIPAGHLRAALTQLGSVRYAWWLPPAQDQQRHYASLRAAVQRTSLEEAISFELLPPHQSPSAVKAVRALLGTAKFNSEMRGRGAGQGDEDDRPQKVIPRIPFEVFQKTVLHRDGLKHLHADEYRTVGVFQNAHPNFRLMFNPSDTHAARSAVVDGGHLVRSHWCDRSALHRNVLVCHVLYDPSGGGGSNAVILSCIPTLPRKTWLDSLDLNKVTLRNLDEHLRLEETTPFILTGADVLPKSDVKDDGLVAEYLLMHMAKFMYVYHNWCFDDEGDVMFVVHIEANMMTLRNPIPDRMMQYAAEDATLQSRSFQRIMESLREMRRDRIFGERTLQNRIVFAHAPQGAVMEKLSKEVGLSTPSEYRDRVWTRGKRADQDLLKQAFRSHILRQLTDGQGVPVIDTQTVGFMTTSHTKNAGFTRLKAAIEQQNLVVHPSFFSTLSDDVDADLIQLLLMEVHTIEQDLRTELKNKVRSGIPASAHNAESRQSASEVGLNIAPMYVYGKGVNKHVTDDLVTLIASAMIFADYALSKFWLLYDFVHRHQ